MDWMRGGGVTKKDGKSPCYDVTTHTMTKIMAVFIIMVLNLYLKSAVTLSQSLISLTLSPLETPVGTSSSNFYLFVVIASGP